MRARPVGYIFIILFTALLFSGRLQAQKESPPLPTTRILFVFDASFSMYGQWQSGMKMDIAKKILTEFLDSLKAIPNLEIAFRAYGHQYPLRPQRNCEDTKLEVPFAPARNNVTPIINRLRGIVPKGTTPIAYTLEKCADDFTPCSGCRNIVILITDGIEECDGDPCAVSMALQKKGIILKPFIIGVGLGVQFADAFQCMGRYYDASVESNFKTILSVVISQALNNTTAQVNLLDILGRPMETDVNMTFYDQGSGLIRYDYMHTTNNRGNPDTLVLDPLITYHLVVHTIPPVEKRDISLVAGKHNIIALDAPQGHLYLKTPGVSNYRQLNCIVRKKGVMKTTHVQEFNTVEKYIVGLYDLEILTLPRILLNDVKISQSATTNIEIPQAGMLNIVKPYEGPGSLYLEDKSRLVWVCNLRDNLLQENIVLQPGNYRIEFRGRNIKESIYTIERRFIINSSVTTSVRIF